MQIVSVLACVVVFCTTYALILPAITMTGTTWCGYEAHEHGESCYEKTVSDLFDSDLYVSYFFLRRDGRQGRRL